MTCPPILKRWLLAGWLGVLAAGTAGAASFPVRPRPECPLPVGEVARRLAQSPQCLGPLHGARAPPRRRAGRQQQRMVFCNTQARWRGLHGVERARFLRACLRRRG